MVPFRSCNASSEMDVTRRQRENRKKEIQDKVKNIVLVQGVVHYRGGWWLRSRAAPQPAGQPCRSTTCQGVGTKEDLKDRFCALSF